MNNKYEIVVKKGGSLVFKDDSNLPVIPGSIEEINNLITLFNMKINYLQTALAATEESSEVNKRVEKIENPDPNTMDLEKVFCETKVIESLGFKGGLYDCSFILGERADKHSQIASTTLKLISATDIYYGETRVVVKGESIPFYYHVQSWETKQIEGGVLKVVLDIRPAGVYGSDFEPNLVNDGESHYGNDFKIRIKPVYEVPK